MKNRLYIIGAVAILAGVALAANQDILLRRTLQPNAKDVYAVEMNSKNIVSLGSMGMGDQEMEIKGTMVIAVSTGAVANNKADVEMKTTDIKLEFGGMAAMAAGAMGQMPKELVVKAKMDDRNRLSDLKMEGVDARTAMMMNSSMQTTGQFIEFPEKPVKVGDTWEVVVPKNEITGTQEAKLTAKLLEVRDEGYAISMTGNVPIKVDLAEMAKKNPKVAEGMPVTDVLVNGTMDMKMEGLFDKTNGRTIRMTTRLKQKTTTEVKSMGVSSDSSGETVIKMTLK